MSVFIFPTFDATAASTTVELPGNDKGLRWHEITVEVVDGAGDPASTTGTISGFAKLIGSSIFTPFTEALDLAIPDFAWNPFMSSVSEFQFDSTVVEADRFLTITVNSWSA